MGELKMLFRHFNFNKGTDLVQFLKNIFYKTAKILI